MFVMACLFGFTLNIVEAFETTYTMMIAFYVSFHRPHIVLPPAPVFYGSFGLGDYRRELTRFLAYASSVPSGVFNVHSVPDTDGPGLYDSAGYHGSRQWCDLDCGYSY